MKIVDRVHSGIDNTVKYTFELYDGAIAEVSYIDKNDDKDIFCVPTQTGCALGCKFCHTTDHLGSIKIRSLYSEEISQMVTDVRRELVPDDAVKIMLVSYMGCGEPLCKPIQTLYSMKSLRGAFPNSRFAISTLIPKEAWIDFFKLTDIIQHYKLNVKIHLSLHFVDDEIRKEWMPAALPIGPALAALEFYRKHTGNRVEVHYTLIDGVNDAVMYAERLSQLLAGRGIPVKFLRFNPRQSMQTKASTDKQVGDFMQVMSYHSIPCEYYVPPGLDIGSSCGMFMMDKYVR